MFWSNGSHHLGFTCTVSTVSSVERLCSVDLNSSDSAIQMDQMEPLLSACQQIHKAGYLSSILNRQVFNL